MNDFERICECLHYFRKSVVGAVLRDPESIPAEGRVFFHSQHGVGGGVDFEGGIRMKSGEWPGSMNEVFPPISIGSFDIDCLAICLGWMGIENTVMLEKLFLLGNCQILVSKEHHSSLL